MGRYTSPETSNILKRGLTMAISCFLTYILIQEVKNMNNLQGNSLSSYEYNILIRSFNDNK